MRYLKIVVAVLIIILGVVFVLQNTDLQRPIRLGFDPMFLFHGLTQKADQGAGEASVPAGQGETGTPGQGGEGAGIPGFILIFIAFFVGVLAASFYGIMEKYRLKRMIKASNQRTGELEEELKKLRNLPLTQPTTQPTMSPPRLAEPPFEPEEHEPAEPPAKAEDR